MMYNEITSNLMLLTYMYLPRALDHYGLGAGDTV